MCLSAHLPFSFFYIEISACNEYKSFHEQADKIIVSLWRVYILSQVAWIHYDRSAILTVQNNVITRNPRIGVSHDGHSVWNLHIRYNDTRKITGKKGKIYLLIRDVERSDEGQYMCQINTARAKTRLGNLHVVGELIRKIETGPVWC